MIGGGAQKITVEIGGKIAASLGASLRSAQAQVSTFGRNVNRTMNDAATAGKKGFKSIFGNDLWQGATAGAVAFTGAIGLSVKKAMEFDTAMADVRKAIDFADGEKGAKRFGRELVKLSSELPYTAAELTNIAAAAGFAGYAEKDIIPFTRAAARMGIAFQMTAEQAGDAMVALRASMGLTQPEVEQLGDAINYLSDRFQGTVNAADLTEVTRRIGAIGKASGLAKEEIAGLGAAFLASGTPTEVAATGLKNFLNALTKGDQATKKQVEALQALFGSDVSDKLAKGMQKDAEGTIKSVIQAMAKLPADKRVSVAGALFGEESKSAIMPLLTNTKLLDQAFDLIADKSAFAGSMQKEFANQMATSGAQAKIFGNGMNAVGISIGAAILPSLNAVLKSVTPLLVKFAEWAQKNEGLVTGIVLIGAGLAGLVLAMPFIASFVSVIGSLSAAITAAGGAGVVLGGIFAALTGPVTLTIAAIVGVGAALVWAYQKFGWFRQAVNTIFAGIGNIVGGIFDQIKGAWTMLMGIFTGDSQKITQGFNQALGGVGRVFQGIGQIASSVWQWIVGSVKTAVGAIGSALQALPGLVGNIFRGVLQVGQMLFGMLPQPVQGAIKTILGILFPIPALIIRNWRGIVSGVQGIFNRVVAFIQQTPSRVASVGSAVIEAIINGLKSKVGELFGWIRGTWGQVTSFFSGADPGEPAAPVRTPGGNPRAGTYQGGQRSGLTPRAMGGPVRAGFPYLVGERRPELFVPGMSGAIVPKVARPVTAAALAGLLAAPLPAAAAGSAPVTIHAPVTINAGAGADAMEIRRQVELAFSDIQREIESSHRVLLND